VAVIMLGMSSPYSLNGCLGSGATLGTQLNYATVK
jgi:hypothetical protein